MIKCLFGFRRCASLRFRPLHPSVSDAFTSRRGSNVLVSRPISTARPIRSEFASLATAAIDINDPDSTISDGNSPVSTEVALEPPERGVMQLRPYQQSAIASCLNAIESGLTRIGVSSPTGSGKTTMFMSLIPLVPDLPDQTRGQVLIIVSSVELAIQAENAARRILGAEWSVEVEQGARHASGRADVTIATYQTMNKTDRLHKFDPEKFRLIIVDEAHHAAAISYLRLLHYFNEEVKLPESMSPIMKDTWGHQVPVIGFSATFSRPDQLALSAVFEKIVFHREIVSMLEEGWLSPAKSVSVKCDLDLSSVEINQTGDFNSTSLSTHVNTKPINDLIVRAYLYRAVTRRSTLIFCVDLSHVDAVTSSFRAAGVDARSISSLSHGSTRKETLAAFSRGEFPVLVNCEVLTEGADIPEIDCIILARPTRSRNLLAQMVGRGLRLSPKTGKIDCLLIDIVDNVGRANGLMVSPTLFGLSYEDLEAERRNHSQTVVLEQGDGPTVTSNTDLKVRKVTFIDLEDPFGLGRGSFKPLATISHNAWVACGNNRYVLELLGNGSIVVDQTPSGLFSVTHRRKLPVKISKANFAKPRLVAEAEDLERAIQTADRWAERVLGRSLVQKFAPWRSKPPSQKALEIFLKARGIDLLENTSKEQEITVMGRNMPLWKVTAGQVAAYVCAANHGATSRYRKQENVIQRVRRKAAKDQEKASALASRNLPFPLEE